MKRLLLSFSFAMDEVLLRVLDSISLFLVWKNVDITVAAAAVGNLNELFPINELKLTRLKNHVNQW